MQTLVYLTETSSPTKWSTCGPQASEEEAPNLAQIRFTPKDRVIGRRGSLKILGAAAKRTLRASFTDLRLVGFTRYDAS
jgi:hypothetical protein